MKAVSCMCTESIGFEQAAWASYPAPPPGTVVPLANTLPSLLDTYALTVGLNSGPLEYQFDGFPKTVRYVVDAITLTQLASTDLAFLSNLLCAPNGATTIANNSKLASLAGLKAKFSKFSTSDQQLTMSNNPELFQPGFQQLGSALRCNGTTSRLTLSQVFVAPADCPNNGNALSTVADVCSYLVNGC